MSIEIINFPPYTVELGHGPNGESQEIANDQSGQQLVNGFIDRKGKTATRIGFDGNTYVEGAEVGEDLLLTRHNDGSLELTRFAADKESFEAVTIADNSVTYESSAPLDEGVPAEVAAYRMYQDAISRIRRNKAGRVIAERLGQL